MQTNGGSVLQFPMILYADSEDYDIQSNLVISNSLISNYRLSRSENLVPVLT